MTKSFLYDGSSLKSFENMPEESWTTISGGTDGGEMRELFNAVPWLQRGVTMRANRTASVPFSIWQGDKEVDRSESYQNVCGFMPNPQQLILQLDTSLVMWGKGYGHIARNNFNFIKDIRFISQQSIMPVIKTDGLRRFDRILNDGKKQPKPIEETLYIWMIDPWIEYGEPRTSPALNALVSSGVLKNLDAFVSSYFERGAVKASIMTVPGGTQPDEREKLQKWYTGVISGIKNAWAMRVLNADAVTVIPIGEGVKDLANTALSKDARESISTALGIPQSLMWSSTSTDNNRIEDEKSFIKNTISPDILLIAEALNRQCFKPMGYEFKPRIQSLPEMQTDEEKRGQAFAHYRDGGMPLDLTVAMLGLDLPEGYELPEEPDPQSKPAQGNQDEKNRERKAFKNWYKNRKSADPADFTFNVLDEKDQADIINACKAKATAEDHKPLLDNLTKAIDNVRAMPLENIVNVELPKAQTVINVQPSDVIVENKVDVPEVKIDNKVLLPEPKPRTTKVKRNSHGDILEMKTD